jgi:hypothetical protein
VSVQYTNRKKVTYYLHEDTEKSGEARYFFSDSLDGKLVDVVPEGFEIYEDPNALVFLRKFRPIHISNTEKQLIDQYIHKLATSRRYVVDVWGNDMTVFQSNEDVDVLKEVFDGASLNGCTIEEAIDYTISFTPVFRFCLEDPEKRTFILKRYTFPGSIEIWRQVGGPDSLENLSECLMEMETDALV